MASISAMGRLLVLARCLSATAVQAGVLEPREQRRLGSQLEQRPMVFFIAKGPADSCGRSCNEWIAAVGKFDDDTLQRFKSFVETLHGRNLPIFFHSPGGLAKAGVEIGLALRERRMTAGVGQTETRRCRVFEKKDTDCQNLINTGRAVDARLITRGGQCYSACVLAFAGASSRQVASGAFIGIHSPKFKDNPLQFKTLPMLPDLPTGKITPRKLQEIRIILKKRHDIIEGYSNTKPSDALVASYRQTERRYYLDMGINPEMVDLALKTPNERIYLLDRGEIGHFGLETRDKNFETPWTTFSITNQGFSLMKTVTRRSFTQPSEYLALRVQFVCQPNGRAFLLYQKDLAADSDQPKITMSVALDDRIIAFQSRPPQARVETGFYFMRDQEAWTNVTTAKTMAVIEKNEGDGTLLETRLSTAGLGTALEDFQKRCDDYAEALKFFADHPSLAPETKFPVLWPQISPKCLSEGKFLC